MFPSVDIKWVKNYFSNCWNCDFDILLTLKSIFFWNFYLFIIIKSLNLWRSQKRSSTRSLLTSKTNFYKFRFHARIKLRKPEVTFRWKEEKLLFYAGVKRLLLQQETKTIFEIFFGVPYLATFIFAFFYKWIACIIADFHPGVGVRTHDLLVMSRLP